MKPVIPQTCIFLDEQSALCIIRDVTLDCPASPCGSITILGQPIPVRFSSTHDGCYVLEENYPANIEVFFWGEEPKEEERERHPWHVQRNIYWGGCRFCDCERETHEVEIASRKVTHVSYQEPYDIIGAAVRGLVEGATTQEDMVWLLEDFSGDLEAAKQAVANNPLAKNAIWLDDNDLQKLVNALPPARQGQSYVDFGDPHFDAWAR